MGSAIVYGIKIAITVATAVAFFAGILVIINVMADIATVPTIFTDVIRLIGLYLPFKPSTVFSVVLVDMGLVFSFLAARKVYQLMSTIQRDA